MSKENVKYPFINELLSSEASEKVAQAVETVSTLQQRLYTLTVNEDSSKLDLLKIGTVFQIFYIDTLAAGKKPGDLTEDDWKSIAEKVDRYAVMEDGQPYSEFVFSLYADYIDISAETIQLRISDRNYHSIKETSDTIRQNTERLRNGEMTETAYVEACLWLSLEAMIKLLSSSLAIIIGPEYAELAQAASQLAFEYGRYVLFAREQAILERYIKNQYLLDERLKKDYEAYLEEVQEQAAFFQNLIDKAFSPDLHESLIQSAALARAAGVKEEELLTSVEDIDAFFM